MRGKYITTNLQLAVLADGTQKKSKSKPSKSIIEGQQGTWSKEFLPRLQAAVETDEDCCKDDNKSYFIL